MDRDIFVASTDMLANLIDDILLSILEYLPKASLTGIARVSRRFRALTLPILYYSIDLSIATPKHLTMIF
jgi:hypothetical protein